MDILLKTFCKYFQNTELIFRIHNAKLNTFFKGDLMPRLHPLFLWYTCVSFTEKEPCENFWDVLVRFSQVIKLQSSGFSVSDIIPENVQKISPLVFSVFFC